MGRVQSAMPGIDGIGGERNKGKFLVFLNLLHVKGLFTHNHESLDVDLRLITKNSFLLLDLLLYVADNSYIWTCRDVSR